MTQNKKKGVAKKALSISLVAAMLATSNVPVWASFEAMDDATGFIAVEETGSDSLMTAIDNNAIITDNLKVNGGNVNAVSFGTTIQISGDVMKIVDDVESRLDKYHYEWKIGDKIFEEGDVNVQDGKDTSVMSLKTTKEMAGKTYELWIERYDADYNVNINKSTGIEVTVTYINQLSLSDMVWKTSASGEELARGKMPEYTYENGQTYEPVLAAFYLKENGKETRYDVQDQNTGTHYDYIDNNKVGEAYVKVTLNDDKGTGVVLSEATYPFKIVNKSFKETDVQWPTSLTWAPNTKFVENAKAAVSISGLEKLDDEGKNAETADYEVIVTPGLVGKETAKIDVQGLNEYKGINFTKWIDVTAYDISNAYVADIEDQKYTGNEITPSIIVKYADKDGENLSEYYDITYSANRNVGTATITLTGKGNCTGTKTITFNIVNSTFSDEIKAAFNNTKVTYSGKEQRPFDKNMGTMIWKNDFTVSYINNVDAGTATAIITGIGTYAGATYKTTFTIEKANLHETKITVADTTFYKELINGTEMSQKPAVTVTFNGVVVREGIDYTATYEVQGSAGYRTIKVTLNETKAANSNFEGTGEGIGKVISKELSSVTIPSIPSQPYIGKAITINDLKLSDDTQFIDGIKDGDAKLTLNRDYIVSYYKNNVNVGTATMVLAGKGDYKGQVIVTFPIDTVKMNAAFYYGAADGTTFPGVPDIEYNYNDSVKKDGIQHKVSDSIRVVLTEDCVFAGTKYKAGTIAKAEWFDLTYSENKAVGIATITATGKKGYDISAKATFRITPKVISNAEIVVTNTPYYYTGEEIKATYKVTATDGAYTLKEGVDYEVSYKDNINATTNEKEASVIVKGIGNYILKSNADSKDEYDFEPFEISKANITNSNVTVKNVAYAGGIQVTPDITVVNPYSGKELVAGTDYTVNITEGGVKVGAAQAEIKLTTNGKANYTLGGDSKMIIRFNVTKKALSDCSITVNQGKITVTNGDVIVPESEYTITENADGSYTVSAKADGNYTGSVSVDGVKAPASTTLKVTNRTTSTVSLAWDEVKGAEGYTIWFRSEYDTKVSRKVIQGGDVTSWTQ